MVQIDYRQYIEVATEIGFGKPVIKGTPIRVQDILCWLACGIKQEEIINDFPQLTEKQILACVAYAANKERLKKVA